MLNVVLCGAGYRGRNLLRVLHQNPGFHVRCVADQSEEAREAAQRIAPGIRTVAEAQAARIVSAHRRPAPSRPAPSRPAPSRADQPSPSRSVH